MLRENERPERLGYRSKETAISARSMILSSMTKTGRYATWSPTPVAGCQGARCSSRPSLSIKQIGKEKDCRSCSPSEQGKEQSRYQHG